MNHSNNYTFDKDKLCFIHIPKSGGTTLFKLFKNNEIGQIHKPAHYPISILCPPSDFNYLTILRNPIDRVVSYYNMVKREGRNYPHGEYSDNYRLFLENCWEVNNQVTLYIAGINCVDIAKNKDFNLVNEEIFETAKNNLNNFKNILFFDKLEEDIHNFFKNEYDIHLKEIPNERKFNYSKVISEEDRKLIEEHNKYDILLYQYAKDKYIN